jgi:hypothetical protein
MAGRAILIALAVLAYSVRVPAAWVERWYSRGLYARLQPVLTGVSNQVPFALLDVLLVVAIVSAVVATVQVCARPWRGRVLREIGRFGLSLVAAGAAVYLVFWGAWGLNYERQPLAQRLDLNQDAANHDALLRLARTIVGQLNDVHDRAHGEGFPAWEQMRPSMERAFRATQTWLAPGTHPRAGAPKWSLLSYYFERAGVSGMTDPFFLEVLVDRDLLPFERPFVLAHEWAHLSGYADEAEANFVGWVTCVNGAAPAAYSGWLYLYSEALGALPREDRVPLVRALAAGPRADLLAVAERARRIQPVLQEVSWRVYDRYLKANRVGEGIASYDRALVLVLGSRFVNGWMPVLKTPASR